MFEWILVVLWLLLVCISIYLRTRFVWSILIGCRY